MPQAGLTWSGDDTPGLLTLEEPNSYGASAQDSKNVPALTLDGPNIGSTVISVNL